MEAVANSNLQALLQLAERLAEGTVDADLLKELVAATFRAVASIKSTAVTPAAVSELQSVAAALWNAAIDSSQQQPSGEAPASARDIAVVKQCASDLLAHLPLDCMDAPRQRLTVIDTFHKVGAAWAALEEYEAADTAYKRAWESTEWLKEVCLSSRCWDSFKEECSTLYFSLMRDRLLVAWALKQEMPASAMLLCAQEFACGEQLPSNVGLGLKLELFHVLKSQAVVLLKDGKHCDGVNLLTTAYEVLHALCDADSGDMEAELQDMACQVLNLLVWAHCEGSSADPGQLLNHLQVVQQMEEGQPASRIMLPFLSHKVFLKLGRFDEAQAELLNIVSHEEATAEVCTEAIKRALAHPEGLQSVRAALPMVFERFPEETGLILELAGTLAATSAAPEAGSAKAGSSSRASACEELEGLVLETVADDRVLEMLQEEPAHQRKLHCLLWNHAVSLMGAGRFEAALHFFVASLSLEEGQQERLQGLHAQALCCASMGAHDRALQYVAAAEEVQPRSLPTGYLRVKLLLSAHDPTAAAAAVAQLMECEGATPDVLRVVCIEAMDAGELACAKQALVLLLDAIAAGQGGDAMQVPGYEATVFLNLIKLIQGAVPQPPAAGAASMEVDGPEGRQGPALPAEAAAAAERYAELAKYCDLVVQRIKAVGVQGFFHEEGGKHVQLEWLAMTAWSAAAEASAGGHMQQAAVLMGACGELWAAHPRPSSATLSKQKAGFLLGASLALEVFDGTPEFVNALALTQQHLAGAKKAAAAMQSGLPLGAAPADPKADAFLLVMEFNLAARQRDIPAQLDVVERAKAQPALGAEHFGMMANAVKEGPYKNNDVLKAAQAARLQRLTSQPALDYPAVAAVLRTLVELSLSDNEKLQLFSEAQSILSAAPQGAFPAREAEWLVTAAWNRGAMMSKFNQSALAADMMRVALEAQRACPSLEVHKERMQEDLKEQQHKAAALARTPPGKEGAMSNGVKRAVKLPGLSMSDRMEAM